MGFLDIIYLMNMSLELGGRLLDILIYMFFYRKLYRLVKFKVYNVCFFIWVIYFCFNYICGIFSRDFVVYSYC